MAIEHIIPLRRGFVKVPKHKRSKRAMTVLRAYLERHLKADEIKIGQYLNEHVWANGIRNPPGKVAVSAEIVDIDGVKVAHVELQGKKFSESVRPEDKVEEAGGLKGKLQAITQKEDKKETEAQEESKEKPEATIKEKSETPVKTPIKTVKKTPAKKTAKTK